MLILKHLNIKTFLSVFMALCLSSAPDMGHTQDLLGQSRVRSEQVTAELMAHAPEGVAPGHPVWVGLQLSHAQGWHTYWKNAGDSGMPTQLEWQLPPGVTAGEVVWPTPKKFALGPLANYGYDGTLLLMVPLIIDPGFSAQRLDVKLNASWLACRQECIPEDAQLQLSVPVQSPTSLNGRVFEETLQRQPKPAANKSSRSGVEGQFFVFSSADLPTAWVGKKLVLFPETTEILQPGSPWTQEWKGQTWSARIPLNPLRTESPASLAVVLTPDTDVAHDEPAPAGVRLSVAVTGPWPAPTTQAATGVSPALNAALQQNAAQAPRAASPALAQWDTSFWLAILGAFLGGLILNLMPCVFPVLAIKVLAFTQHGEAGSKAAVVRSHRLSGLAYTAGVLLSFVALGGLLVALRAGGEQLGWGFQLQSPAVVAALAALFTLMGLNLAGVFEFGSLLPSSVASLQAKNPTVDSFLTGVLATAVASPCTAPFMGASLGLAVGLPALQALLVFAAIGLGLAAPYLAASWAPGIAHALPRPGAWMVTFRQFMAFPMLATVVWLVWVLGQQTGINGASALLALLVALAMLTWSLGHAGPARVWLAGVSALLLAGLLASAGSLVLEQDSTGPAETGAVASAHGPWQAWTPQRMAELSAAGQTVFVDYTAAWCVTCQFNKRTTLSNPALLADMAEHKMVLLRADWTRRDPAITTALAEIGRNGVPTYAIYRPGQTPVVLTEVLSVNQVREALAKNN
jgi:thiol:disulfide interchange protein DsbD